MAGTMWLRIRVAVALVSSPLPLLGDVLGKKPIRHLVEGRDGSSRTPLRRDVDPLLYFAKQLSRFDPSLVWRHPPMRSDFDASGSAILSKLGDVDFAAGGECSYAESDDCTSVRDGRPVCPD